MEAQASSLQRELEALDADKQLGRLNASQEENIRQVEQEIAQLNEQREEMNRRYQEEKQLADEIQSLMEAAKKYRIDFRRAGSRTKKPDRETATAGCRRRRQTADFYQRR